MKINFANVGKAIMGVMMSGLGLAVATKGIVSTINTYTDGFTKSDDEITVDNAEVIEEESEDDVVED